LITCLLASLLACLLAPTKDELLLQFASSSHPQAKNPHPKLFQYTDVVFMMFEQINNLFLFEYLKLYGV